MICVYLLSFPAGWGVQGQSLSLTYFCIWQKRNVCWVRSYLASNFCFITFVPLLLKVSWHGIQRDKFAAPLLLGLPGSYSSSRLSSTLFLPFPVLCRSLISLPDGALKKARSFPYPDFLKMHLSLKKKKKKKTFLKQKYI